MTARSPERSPVSYREKLSGGARWLVPIAGALLIVDALRRGEAHLYLFLIVPVLTGGSAEFLLGGLLLFLGIFLLAASGWAGGELSIEPREPGAAAGGGIVLLGPLPIFFGSWKGTSGPRRWRWVALGAILSAAAFALAYFFSR